MSSMTYLRDMMQSISPVEQRIAAYFLDHEDSLVITPILTVAEACTTSKSAVVRLCKRMGYKGYKDFLTTLSAELAIMNHTAETDYTDIYPESNVKNICAIVTQHACHALDNTLRLLDMNALEKAVEVLCATPRIDLYGAGNSGIIAQDAELKFRRIGFNANSAVDSHRQVIYASTLKPGDAAMFFSYYGETKDMLDAVAIAKQQGATTIAVTRFGKSTLSTQADIVLSVASMEKMSRSGAMTSRLVMLNMVDMLFTCISSQKYDILRPVLEHTAHAIQAKRRI